MTANGTNFDLLTEPLIEIQNAEGLNSFVTLPTVMASLGQDADIEFPGLQTHHHHPWHAFLVQLAGLALDNAGTTASSISAEEWTQHLKALVEDEAAWCIFTEELDRPAFMQPPVPEGNLSKLKHSTIHPDRLDLLVTAKNHEVKAETVATSNPLDSARYLIPSLIAFQTFNGYSGRGNMSTARSLNSGFANRAAVSLTPNLRWATRFLRDLKTLQRERKSVVNSIGFTSQNGIKLLWTLPWEGLQHEALRTPQLDPWYIEICRRARVIVSNDTLQLRFGPTLAARVDAKEKLGNLGDPWTPVRRKDGATLTVSERGFHYRLVTDLLFRDDVYQKAPAQIIQDEDPEEMIAVLMALVRGQGKTGGYHERYIPIPSQVCILMKGDDSLIADLAKDRIEMIVDVQKRILKPAILALLQGDSQDLDFTDSRALPWVNRLDEEIDRIFFNKLFDDLHKSVEEQEKNWQDLLWRLTKSLFDEATQALPLNENRSLISTIRAFEFLRSKAKKVIPYAFKPAISDNSN